MLTLSKFTASQALEKALLAPPPPPNLYPLCRQREELGGLFQIQNCVNLVAGVHEAVQGRGREGGGGSGGGEDSVWRISPGPGGLHLAPYPHAGYCDLLYELSTWSSQLPRGLGLSFCFFFSFFLNTTVLQFVSETPQTIKLENANAKRISHVASFCNLCSSSLTISV